MRRAELFEEIISREHLLDAVTERRGLRGARPSRHWRFRVQGARRLAIVWTLAAVTAAVVAVAVIAGSADRSPTTATVVSFRNAGDNEITATVTDPFAAESRLKAAFAQQHLNITVTLVPVSPSLVGTVIYTGGYGGAMSEIQALHGGHCVTGGGRCPIGVKIPTTFTGQGYIGLGRPAKPGETYQSQASAFAPGELLHCSHLLGARVSHALPVLKADKLTIQWRGAGTEAGSSKADTTPPGTSYIWDASMASPRVVFLFTAPQPWPSDVAHGAAVNRGCS